MQLTLSDVAEDSFTQLIFADRRLRRRRWRRPALRPLPDRLGGQALELHGLAFVPGVTLTGRIEHWLSRRQHGRLRIGGSAAPHGVLTIRGFRLRGRLGGRRVRLRRRTRVPRSPRCAQSNQLLSGP